MAHPKRKTSKAWRDARRSHLALVTPNYSTCPRCHKLKMAHRICGNCGYYKGKAIIKV